MIKRVVVLYSELADYSMACLKQLSNDGVDILLVHWPVNPEAPFEFDFSFTYQSIDRSAINKSQLLEAVTSFSPDLILCSGWMDKVYMSICKRWYGKTPTVLSLDNHWNGSLKQQLARIIAPFTLLKTFSHAFVPGEIQRAYARKLGFPNEKIKTGFYVANVEKFKSYYDRRMASVNESANRRFLYLGRYVEHKGIFELWDAFKRFQEDLPDWELWCVGTGECFENRTQSQGIRHFGFIQPADLLPILQDTGIYILPSRFEPWGVSVQEMAIAGFPLMLSDAIGSREAFLDKSNGIVFESGNVEAIFKAMTVMAQRSEEQRLSMSHRSHQIGMKYTPEIWAETLMNMTNV